VANWRHDRTGSEITGLYRRAWAHSDATIGALGLDAIGRVPWWPENHSEVTLHKILVHMIARGRPRPGARGRLTRPRPADRLAFGRPPCAWHDDHEH